MGIPISMFAAGPVREATSRTTLSPMDQHWWRAMASNCIIHGRNCTDTVPSNTGTFGLDDGRDAELFISLLMFRLSECWASPLSSCMGRWLRLPRVGSVVADWLTGDVKWKSGRCLDGTPDGVMGVLIVGAHGESKWRAAERCVGWGRISRENARGLPAFV